MIQNSIAQETEVTRSYRAFSDGDSLAITLPPDPDYSWFSRLIIYQIKQAGSAGINRVLIDCSLVVDVDVSQLAHFVILGLGLQHLGTEFVLLDAPADLQAYIQPLVPEADWIESSTRTPHAQARPSGMSG